MERFWRLCLGVLVTLTANAHAAGYPPTDIELRAAYCLTAARQQVANLATPDEIREQLKPEQQDFLKAEQAKANANLHRLQSYLLPKKHLNPEALLAAMNRHHADTALLESCSVQLQCFSVARDKKKLQDCYEKCNVETGGTRDRLKACVDLFWLPF